MGFKCTVPHCSNINGSSFKVPSNMWKQWEKALGTNLKKSSRVCSLHFKQGDIIDSWESGSGFSKYVIQLKKSRLKNGVVPISISNNSKILDNSSISECFEVLSNDIRGCKMIKDNPTCAKKIEVENGVSYELYSLQEKMLLENNYTEIVLENEKLFQQILKNRSLIDIPLNWSWRLSRKKKKELVISFYKISTYCYDYIQHIEKQISITEGSDILIFVYGKKISNERISTIIPNNITDFQNFILELDKIKICHGSSDTIKFAHVKHFFGNSYEEYFSRIRHINCSLLIDDNGAMCVWCKKLLSSMQNKHVRLLNGKKCREYISTIEKAEIENLRISLRNTNKKFRRARKRIEILKFCKF
ncbi:uncharacterized protein LOC126898488 isoform X2 [Daktulosphaira vitifoliae]|uniref:uncharacterized protein LOC126898488 isoform X2 n=1 Tax=Daktulosphaira vitifoliae TaxID=58002 RepID=UPI0021AAB62A|nr:uncharacterized protein LOC126898488 isoform X2 [Daktulosphaira vitifoliae]